MVKVDKVKRFAVIQLDATRAKVDENGMLRAPVTLTRTGVFQYREADGSIRRELRTPEEVFAQPAMDSFELVPFVDEHPYAEKGEVTAQNAKRLQGGSVGRISRDGVKLNGEVMVTDEKMVAKILSGKTAVSAGYYCDREWTPGTTADGEAYDCIQRNIRANHVALVQVGRAGPEARIRLDANEAVQLDGENNTPQKGKKTMEKTITHDGLAATMPEQSASIVTKWLSDAATARQAAEAKAAKLATDAADLIKARDVITAERDTLKADLKKAQDPALFSAAVQARVALESKARSYLGADIKLDGLEARAIKVAVIAKQSPDIKCDGQTDDYVNACYDLATVKPAAPSNAATDTVAAQLAAAKAVTADATDIDPFKQSLADFFNPSTDAK